MYCKKLSVFLLSTALAAIAQPIHAAEEKDPYADTLLGDVAGYRSTLSHAGVDVTVDYKADMFDVVSGGLKRGSNYLDNLDIQFTLDNEKLLGINGNKAFIYFVSNAGSKPSASRVGSIEGIDNVEVIHDTFKLLEAWDEQSFFGDTLSVLVGLHDLNSEFAVTDLSKNFLKPTMQIGQAFAQSGRNGPSLFPTTSVAARVKVAPTETTYVSAAVFDGVPGNVNRPHGTHIDFESSDGVLMIAEAGYTPKAAEGVEYQVNKFAVGGWVYSQKADNLVEVDSNGNPVKDRQAGAYLLSSYQIYNDARAGHTLGLFLRGDIANDDALQVDWDYQVGVVGNGWVPTRPDSEIGAGLSQSHNGDTYMDSVGGAADRNEYGLEVYYRDKLEKGITVQPDFQYIINPGMDQGTDNTTILGVRFDINF